MKTTLQALTLLCIALLFACNQDKPEIRTYTEFFQEAPSASPTQVQTAWTWNAPAGYKPGKGDAMRIATFTKQGLDMSILSLPGDAGGLQSNLVRWAGQISLNVQPEQIATWIKSNKPESTQNDLPAMIFNFADFQDKTELDKPSMISAVIYGNNEILFIKLSGNLKYTQPEVQIFTDFVKSLSYAPSASQPKSGAK
jgi:hypothetical protein